MSATGHPGDAPRRRLRIAGYSIADMATVFAALALGALVAYLASARPGDDWLPGAVALALVVIAVGGVVYRVQGDAERFARVADAVMSASGTDPDVRCGVRGSDAIGRLGEAVDTLLEGRAGALADLARESDALNDSVVGIMQAVGEIATSKDLTRRVPVTEDVTGAISDALNLLTEEMERVLRNVTRVSHDVAKATLAVRGQGDNAGAAAAREHREVGLAATALSDAWRALNAVSHDARGADDAAHRASAATQAAMGIVGQSAARVEESEAVVRDVEQRLKRLGERSQEIGQATAMIQSIAARTGVLALNASMYASAAGADRRSFTTIADEVRGLSVSAQRATGEIGRLVGAIQSETAAVVTAMSRLIAEFGHIGELSRRTSEEMRHAADETERLAEGARRIAATAAEQVAACADLEQRALVIRAASEDTMRELAAQSVETRRLVDDARSLLEHVGVFRIEP